MDRGIAESTGNEGWSAIRRATPEGCQENLLYRIGRIRGPPRAASAGVPAIRRALAINRSNHPRIALWTGKFSRAPRHFIHQTQRRKTIELIGRGNFFGHLWERPDCYRDSHPLRPFGKVPGHAADGLFCGDFTPARKNCHAQLIQDRGIGFPFVA